MKIRCLIVDDEPLARLGIINLLKNVKSAELVNAVNSTEAATKVINKEKIDLLFLDINMPGRSGLDFLEIPSKLPLVILVTAYPEYALVSYEFDVVDYLVKPVSLERFVKAMAKVESLLISKKPVTNKVSGEDHFFIRADGRHEKIFYHEVLYLEALLNYIRIVTLHKSYITYSSLKSIEEKFPEDQFVRIHKSFIISISKVSAIEGNKVYIGTKELPISRSLKESIHKLLLKG